MQEAQLAIGYLPIQRLEAEEFVETRFSRFFRMGGVMPAADGYVELLTLEPRQWEGLARLLGEPEWASADKFRDPATHGPAINENLRQWTAEHTRERLYREGTGPRRADCALPYARRSLRESAAARTRLLHSQWIIPKQAATITPGCPSV